MSRCLGLLLAAGVALAAISSTARATTGDEARIAQGFAIAPVPLNLKGLNRAQVGLGSYLVNALGGCNDCHTNPPFAAGGNPFLGEREHINKARYLAGGQSFGPTLVSPNLTPDAKGRPAGLTFRQFADAIRKGHDPDDPSQILQVMPWPTYRNTTPDDLAAIYAFLRAIPSRPD